MSARRPPVLDTDPPELLVYDEPTRCPYLPDQTARLPMRLPSRPLDRQQFARRLEEGDRSLLVVGEPGIGKSTTMQVLARQLSDEVREGRGVSRGAGDTAGKTLGADLEASSAGEGAAPAAARA